LAINDPIGGSSRLRRAAEGSARRSGARAALFWAFALVAGLGTALLIARQLDKRQGGGATQTTNVVVAAVDLSLAAKITPEDIKLVAWPAEHLPIGAFQDPKEVVGRVLISRVLAQQPVLPTMLAAKNAGSGLAALIPPNMRAMAVRVDDVVGVAGFVHADDRVDVLVTLRPNRPGGETTTKVFLQNIKVLAVGQELETADKTRMRATPATVATMLVTPQEAERLALASAEGRLILTLRSWTDSQPVETEGAMPSGLVGDVAPSAPPVAGTPPPVRPAAVAARRARGGKSTAPPSTLTAEAPKKDVVEILRGDRFEERKFNKGENR
jgi:pilus assembly protein CpaB